MGITIDRVSKICQHDGGLGASERSRVHCTADIMDIVESIFMAAAFVSSAISHCAPQTNQQAVCASAAVGLIGGISGLTKNALSLQRACDAGALHLTTKPPFCGPDFQCLPGWLPANGCQCKKDDGKAHHPCIGLHCPHGWHTIAVTKYLCECTSD